MFDAITQKRSSKRGRRWIGFVLASALVNAGLVVGAFFLVPRDPDAAAVDDVPIAFAPKVEAAKVEEAPPPPPPPPPPVARPAAVASGDGGGKRVRRALEAPTSIPSVAPAAVDPVRPPGSEQVGGQGSGGQGKATTAESPPSPSPAASAVRRLVQVTEEMEPPVPSPENKLPEYPEQARLAGLEGMVEIRIAVDGTGSASVVEVERGEEPFLSSVLSVLPDWRFEPARLDGRVVAVARVVRVPFRLHR